MKVDVAAFEKQVTGARIVKPKDELTKMKEPLLKNIDIHGTQVLSNHQTSKFERAFWYTILAVEFVICFVLCCITILGYVEAPTTVKTTSVNTESLLMPDVAICSSYPWNIPKLLRNNFSLSLVQKFIEVYNSSKPDPRVFGGTEGPHNATNSRRNGTVLLEKSLEEKLETELSERISDDDMWKLYLDYGLGCSALLYCRFDTESFPCCPYRENVTVVKEMNLSKKESDPEENVVKRRMVPFQHFALGTCMVAKDMPNQTSSHQNAGLNMLLHMSTDLQEMDKYTVGFPYKAFLLEISEQYMFPTRAVTLLSLQMLTYVTIEASERVRRVESLLFRHPCEMKEDRGSRSDTCKEYCMYNAIIATCNCVIGGYLLDKTPNGTNFCNPIQVRCNEQNHKHILSLADSCEKKKCKLKLCDEWSYSLATSVAMLTDDVLETVKASGKNEKNYRLQDMAILSIRHASTSYRKEVELPVTNLVNLVSFLGGQIGLWLGGSIITVIQLIVLCAKKSTILCHANCSKKQLSEDVEEGYKTELKL